MSLFVRPASTLIGLVAAGELSAVELVRLHLERIQGLNPRLNAITHLRAEQALSEAARQDDESARGVPRGPLGALPVTIKSAVQVEGLCPDLGRIDHLEPPAPADAPAVARLRRAGAIVVGATNVAHMLMAYESDNPRHGRTSNPWDLERTSGGSSGGEAAAIAAGCSAAGLGSDGGGSIRVPAHYSGICGFKPTPGRIPVTGHQPACLGPFSLIGAIGPMARTVADLRLIDAVIAGPDDGDPMAVPLAPMSRAPGAVHVGVLDSVSGSPVTAETSDAVRAAAEALTLAGYVVGGASPTTLVRAGELWEVFFAEAGLLLLNDTMGGAERDLPILRAYLDTRRDAGRLTSRQILDAWIARDQLRTAFLEEMAPARVLISPVASTPAPRHGERSWRVEGHDVGYLGAMRYTQWFNLLGAPAVVVPVGRSADALPIGVQVVGRPFDDDLVLDVAEAIERGCGGYRPPPLSHPLAPVRT